MKKVAIVTGASRGIGRAIATELAGDGINVIACYNKSEKEAKELQNMLREKNIEIDIISGDVSKREDCERIVKFAIEKYNKIDILVNNAGISTSNLFTDITDEEWNRTINVNLNSVFYMSQEVAKNMIKEHIGCIINISSIWGLVGASCEVAYSVSKAGIDGMTKALAKELGPSNIRVNSIAPGYIDTDMNDSVSNEAKNEVIENTPLGRIGKTEDIARCVKWLVEDEFTTGQIISINGGWIIT